MGTCRLPEPNALGLNQGPSQPRWKSDGNSLDALRERVKPQRKAVWTLHSGVRDTKLEGGGKPWV